MALSSSSLAAAISAWPRCAAAKAHGRRSRSPSGTGRRSAPPPSRARRARSGLRPRRGRRRQGRLGKALSSQGLDDRAEMRWAVSGSSSESARKPSTASCFAGLLDSAEVRVDERARAGSRPEGLRIVRRSRPPRLGRVDRRASSAPRATRVRPAGMNASTPPRSTPLWATTPRDGVGESRSACVRRRARWRSGAGSPGSVPARAAAS
jgi:hypothetical protein